VLSLVPYVATLLLLSTLIAPTSGADFHKREITEVFTNATGTVQFIEFFSPDPDQEFLASQEIVTIETNGQTFVLPSDLPSANTENRRRLIATAAFAALPAAPTPDYTIPAGFFSTSSGVLIQYIDN